MNNNSGALNHSHTLGISFTLGAIIDEAQGAHIQKNYVLYQSTSIARKWLVLKWMIIGFFLTLSYKSDLRAMMMNEYYEDTIDNIDDMVASGRKFMVADDTVSKFLLASDPRMKVKKLAERAQFFRHRTGYGTKTGLTDEFTDIVQG